MNADNFSSRKGPSLAASAKTTPTPSTSHGNPETRNKQQPSQQPTQKSSWNQTISGTPSPKKEREGNPHR